MKLEYADIKQESLFIITNFNCQPSRQYLKDKGLYKILWAKDSGQKLRIDGYEVAINKDEIVFCTPLNVLEVITETEGLIAFVFNREFYCIRDHDQEVSCNGLLFYGSSHPPQVKLDQDQKTSFSAMLYLFKEEFKTKDPIQGEMLRVLLKRILILSRRLVKSELVDPKLMNHQMDVIRRFHILVEQHFKEKHQVSDYAELLFKSPKTLSNLFGKYNNKTPLQVINERILLEAKRLLLFSDKTSEEIAYELGYKEAGHFSKFFKKNEGTNPSEFRRLKLAST